MKKFSLYRSDFKNELVFDYICKEMNIKKTEQEMEIEDIEILVLEGKNLNEKNNQT